MADATVWGGHPEPNQFGVVSSAIVVALCDEGQNLKYLGTRGVTWIADILSEW